MTMTATDSAGGTYYPIKLTQSKATIIKGGRTGTEFDTHSFIISSITRSNRTVTLVTSAPTDFGDGAQVYVYGVTGAVDTFNGVFNVQVIDSTTITYSQNGENESGTIDANSNVSTAIDVDWVIAPETATLGESVVILTV
jgi:bifunctional ADP-heptose synthase (sugar kinase/adenylyltransferase)